jgi:hypothetical protein
MFRKFIKIDFDGNFLSSHVFFEFTGNLSKGF